MIVTENEHLFSILKDELGLDYDYITRVGNMYHEAMASIGGAKGSEWGSPLENFVVSGIVGKLAELRSNSGSPEEDWLVVVKLAMMAAIYERNITAECNTMLEGLKDNLELTTTGEPIAAAAAPDDIETRVYNRMTEKAIEGPEQLELPFKPYCPSAKTKEEADCANCTCEYRTNEPSGACNSLHCPLEEAGFGS